MIELDDSQIADGLQDAMVQAFARMAPTGSDRTLPVNATCTALVGLLAEVLIGTQPALPADEVERLTALFQERLAEAFAERAKAFGHA